MVPSEFEYERPNTLNEVLALMRDKPDDVRVMAGGQSLLPLLKLRIVQPAIIVDLMRVPGLTGIEMKSDAIEIGALTTYRAIERSAEIAARCPMLVETMSVIADPHVRNLGTIGGSLCLADPRGDVPSSMLALNATLTATSSSGTRSISIDEFFTGPFSTALREDELLTGIRIPTVGQRSGAYVKLSRRAGDFAVIAVGADVEWGKDGACKGARVALCSAGPMPMLVAGLGDLLAGSRLEDKKIDEAAHHAQGAAEPFEDLLISADYRSAMIHTMVTRALKLARERAGRPA